MLAKSVETSQHKLRGDSRRQICTSTGITEKRRKFCAEQASIIDKLISLPAFESNLS